MRARSWIQVNPETRAFDLCVTSGAFHSFPKTKRSDSHNAPTVWSLAGPRDAALVSYELSLNEMVVRYVHRSGHYCRQMCTANGWQWGWLQGEFIDKDELK